MRRALPKTTCGVKGPGYQLAPGTQSLLLAALKVWEVRQGYINYGNFNGRRKRR